MVICNIKNVLIFVKTWLNKYSIDKVVFMKLKYNSHPAMVLNLLSNPYSAEYGIVSLLIN